VAGFSESGAHPRKPETGGNMIAPLAAQE